MTTHHINHNVNSIDIAIDLESLLFLIRQSPTFEYYSTLQQQICFSTLIITN